MACAGLRAANQRVTIGTTLDARKCRASRVSRAETCAQTACESDVPIYRRDVLEKLAEPEGSKDLQKSAEILGFLNRLLLCPSMCPLLFWGLRSISRCNIVFLGNEFAQSGASFKASNL